MPVHLLNRRRQFATEVEGTPGSAETPADADVVMCVSDDTEFDYSGFGSEEQNLTKSDVGHEPNIPGLQPVTIRGSTVLSGSGTAGTPPAFGTDILIFGGFKHVNVPVTSDTYTPESSPTTDPATVSLWTGPTSSTQGMLEIASGCRPHRMNFRLNAGQIPVLEFEWLGKHVSRADAAAFSPTYTARATPLSVRNSSMSIGAWNPIFTDFNIEVDRGGVIPPDAGAASNASGLSYTRLTDKRITGSITIVDVLEAEKAWVDDLLAGTLADISFVNGTVAGGIMTFTVRNVQLLPPSGTTVDNLVGKSIPWMATRDATADNEMTLAIT